MPSMPRATGCITKPLGVPADWVTENDPSWSTLTSGGNHRGYERARRPSLSDDALKLATRLHSKMQGRVREAVRVEKRG